MGREEEYLTSFQVETLPASGKSLPEDFQLLQAQEAECPLILTCDLSQREGIVSENVSQPEVHVETLTSHTVEELMFPSFSVKLIGCLFLHFIICPC